MGERSPLLEPLRQGAGTSRRLGRLHGLGDTVVPHPVCAAPPWSPKERDRVLLGSAPPAPHLPEHLPQGLLHNQHRGLYSKPLTWINAFLKD